VGQKNLVRILQEHILSGVLNEARGTITHRILSKTIHKNRYELAARFLKDLIESERASVEGKFRHGLTYYADRIAHHLFMGRIDHETLIKVYKDLGYPTYDLSESVDQYPETDADGYTVREYAEIHPPSVMKIITYENDIIMHTTHGNFRVPKVDTEEFHEWLYRCISNIHRLYYNKKRAHLMGLL